MLRTGQYRRKYFLQRSAGSWKGGKISFGESPGSIPPKDGTFPPVRLGRYLTVRGEAVI